jgi:hypothetical protein
MKAEEFPSQYELCRIAAALFGPDAAKKPVKAVRAALGLWLSAGYELGKAKQRDLEENVMAYSEEGYAEGDSLEDVISREEIREMQRAPFLREQIAFGESVETSDAMRWVNEKAQNNRDRFKSFREFEKAWDKVFGDGEVGDGARLFCSVPLLQRFCDERAAQRKAADAARKRKKRAGNKPNDKLSKKIVSGH